MRIVQNDIWLCVDCLMVACNGDTSGIDAGSDEATAARIARIEAGLAELGQHLVPSFDSETGDGIADFMRPARGCAGCGSGLAGTFHRFAVLDE